MGFVNLKKAFCGNKLNDEHDMNSFDYQKVENLYIIRMNVEFELFFRKKKKTRERRCLEQSQTEVASK